MKYVLQLFYPLLCLLTCELATLCRTLLKCHAQGLNTEIRASIMHFLQIFFWNLPSNILSLNTLLEVTQECDTIVGYLLVKSLLVGSGISFDLCTISSTGKCFEQLFPLISTALLVAARLHGFNRTVREVVKTVRISDTTIRKRLGDFRDTPSSQLTIDEFQTIDLEEEQDPPCFTQARKRAKQQLEELNKPEITSELESFQKSIEKILGIDSTRENVHPDDLDKISEREDISKDSSDGSFLVIPSYSTPDFVSNTDINKGTSEFLTFYSLTLTCKFSILFHTFP